MILDLVVEAGNPADSERFLPMLKRHVGFYGEAPRQAAADGGFASRDNLSQAKALGVRDLAFHKKAGLRIVDMVKSNWVYRKLRNFRAGIESDISCLKRAYVPGACVWRGLDHFRAYVWSSVVAYNLALFARLMPTSTPSSAKPAIPSLADRRASTHSNPCAHRGHAGPRKPETGRLTLLPEPSGADTAQLKLIKTPFMDGH